MNFPPSGGEPLTPTHQPIDMMTLYEIFGEIRGMAAEGPLTVKAVEELAQQKDVPRTYAYAATMFDPTIAIESTGDAHIYVCTGRCQMFGSIDILEDLLTLRDKRADANQGPINIVPRSCLDRCDYPPVMMSKSVHGMCTHDFTKKEDLDEIVQAITSDA
jgi:NADH:ubiquinone oxidoreductase subunit E